MVSPLQALRTSMVRGGRYTFEYRACFWQRSICGSGQLCPGSWRVHTVSITAILFDARSYGRYYIYKISGQCCSSTDVASMILERNKIKCFIYYDNKIFHFLATLGLVFVVSRRSWPFCGPIKPPTIQKVASSTLTPLPGKAQSYAGWFINTIAVLYA